MLHAWHPRVDRRKQRKKAIVDAVPACAWSTVSSRAEAAAQQQKNLRCCVDLPCARRRASKWISMGHGVTDGAAVRSGSDGDDGQGKAVMNIASKQCIQSVGRRGLTLRV